MKINRNSVLISAIAIFSFCVGSKFISNSIDVGFELNVAFILLIIWNCSEKE